MCDCLPCHFVTSCCGTRSMVTSASSFVPCTITASYLPLFNVGDVTKCADVTGTCCVIVGVALIMVLKIDEAEL